MDTAGAFLGSLLAVGLMALFANNMHAVFWIAIVPALLAVPCVLIGVEDRAASTDRVRPPIRFADLKRLDRAFWSIAVLGVVFTLARFSEAFLILKASAEGLPLAVAPLVLIVMNSVYMLGAYPAGALADRISARTLLLCGLAALIGADLALAFGPGLVGSFAGIALWGVHMALTQGLLAKLVAESAPEDLRGSAFGFFNLATGAALLLASVIAGLIWQAAGFRRDISRRRRFRRDHGCVGIARRRMKGAVMLFKRQSHLHLCERALLTPLARSVGSDARRLEYRKRGCHEQRYQRRAGIGGELQS